MRERGQYCPICGLRFYSWELQQDEPDRPLCKRWHVIPGKPKPKPTTRQVRV